MERAAKTLHRMSPCILVSVPAKITWLEVGKFGRESGTFHFKDATLLLVFYVHRLFSIFPYHYKTFRVGIQITVNFITELNAQLDKYSLHLREEAL